MVMGALISILVWSSRQEVISLAEIATEGRRKLLTLIKMYDVSPLPPIVQKRRQSIKELHHHSEPEKVQS